MEPIIIRLPYNAGHVRAHAITHVHSTPAITNVPAGPGVPARVHIELTSGRSHMIDVADDAAAFELERTIVADWAKALGSVAP